MIVAVLVLLSLILMATTLFPSIDVTTVSLVGGVLLAVGLARVRRIRASLSASAPAPRRRGSRQRAAHPEGAVDDAAARAAGAPAASTGRKIAMLAMEGYLLLAVALLIVKAVQLGGRLRRADAAASPIIGS